MQRQRLQHRPMPPQPGLIGLLLFNPTISSDEETGHANGIFAYRSQQWPQGSDPLQYATAMHSGFCCGLRGLGAVFGDAEDEVHMAVQDVGLHVFVRLEGDFFMVASFTRASRRVQDRSFAREMQALIRAYWGAATIAFGDLTTLLEVECERAERRIALALDAPRALKRKEVAAARVEASEAVRARVAPACSALGMFLRQRVRDLYVLEGSRSVQPTPAAVGGAASASTPSGAKQQEAAAALVAGTFAGATDVFAAPTGCRVEAPTERKSLSRLLQQLPLHLDQAPVSVHQRLVASLLCERVRDEHVAVVRSTTLLVGPAAPGHATFSGQRVVYSSLPPRDAAALLAAAGLMEVVELLNPVAAGARHAVRVHKPRPVAEAPCAVEAEYEFPRPVPAEAAASGPGTGAEEHYPAPVVAASSAAEALWVFRIGSRMRLACAVGGPLVRANTPTRRMVLQSILDAMGRDYDSLRDADIDGGPHELTVLPLSAVSFLAPVVLPDAAAVVVPPRPRNAGFYGNVPALGEYPHATFNAAYGLGSAPDAWGDAVTEHRPPLVASFELNRLHSGAKAAPRDRDVPRAEESLREWWAAVPEPRRLAVLLSPAAGDSKEQQWAFSGCDGERGIAIVDDGVQGRFDDAAETARRAVRAAGLPAYFSFCTDRS